MYRGPLGPMKAWLVPTPNSTKWTIAVHGIGANKTEMLRFVKPVQAAGSTMLIINYRNDPDNPKSPDGYYHLGDTEWQDLEAAVHYAKDSGAAEVQLYGISLGGSVIENYLRRSSDVPKTNITKVVLDSPALNWSEVLKHQTTKAGYPGFFYYPGIASINMRADISIKRISTKPADVKHKTLLIHNADDPTVPQAASKKLAAARPDLVTFVDFGSGGHARAWNHDPARYEQLVTDFLK
jgi:predicted alpha/beta-fold hydrolase